MRRARADCQHKSVSQKPLRISYYLGAVLPRFYHKQVHFEGFWLEREAI